MEIDIIYSFVSLGECKIKNMFFHLFCESRIIHTFHPVTHYNKVIFSKSSCLDNNQVKYTAGNKNQHNNLVVVNIYQLYTTSVPTTVQQFKKRELLLIYRSLFSATKKVDIAAVEWMLYKKLNEEEWKWMLMIIIMSCSLPNCRRLSETKLDSKNVIENTKHYVFGAFCKLCFQKLKIIMCFNLNSC